MAENMSKAREVFAREILKEFKGKITGDTEEMIVGENPENQYFVGKLLTTENNQKSSYGSDVFVESIGVDFYIEENDFENAKLKIYPRGDFYYRAYPTRKQQLSAILNEINESMSTKYVDYDEVISEFQKNKNTFDSIKMNLIPVYKKVKIDKNNYCINLELKNIFDFETGYGELTEEHSENLNLQEHINDIGNFVMQDADLYTQEIYEKVKVEDLITEEKYIDFKKNYAKKEGSIKQNWSVYINVKLKKIKDKYLVSVSLVNTSKVNSNSTTKKSNMKNKDKPTIETLFNSGMDIKLLGAKFSPIILDYFLDDYKYDSTQEAVGTNCSVVFNSNENIISTEHLPIFIQKRLITNDKLAVKFQDLIDRPIEILNNISLQMYEELKSWRNYYENLKSELSDIAKSKMNEEIKEFEREINRFNFGVKVIEDYPIVFKSFVLMNKTFLNTSKKYNTWRLFQIVYIVSLIPDIVACDENVMTEQEKENTTLGSVSLLYFPTGGGKTEAFLGVLIFNLFFDRFRGKEFGVTSILRYPLRLLSVQQVQRLANVLAQAELLRRKDNNINTTEEFSLGYFVGDNNTPNKISKDMALRYKAMRQEEIDEQRIIDICPFCGKHTVHLTFDESQYRLMHYCDNEKCESDKSLAIYMVDTEIYRYLPSAIISTVDKMAILGNNANFRSLLSGANKKCIRHGYTTRTKCIVEKEFCNVEAHEFIDGEPYDPAPTLFIQDELHLIRESLGIYASHYESFIEYYVKNVSPSKRNIKVIGATATISSYESQITHLYKKDPLRFPCASPYPDKNFYSFVDGEDTQRLILGYAPYGKAIINSVVYSLKYMREVVNKYLLNPQLILSITDIGINNVDDALKILEDYWIFLEYNNVKRDGNNVEGALETPINVELKKQGLTEFKTRKMTGDETFQDVREVLATVENTKNVFDGVNLIVATSMISHGVDADRFNIMFFYGMPGNTAEYIQAYSRTGRKHSSIVVDIMRPSRETDQSYLKNFVKFHEFKDIMVESVPINRWANKAIDGTLPGIFTGLLLNKYDLESSFTIGSLMFMSNIKKAIEQKIIVKDVIKDELYQAYGCVNDGAIDDIGNQYREKIDEFLNDFFIQVTDKNWIEENIFNGFLSLGYRIMNSLRDTDTQLIIELE